METPSVSFLDSLSIYRFLEPSLQKVESFLYESIQESRSTLISTIGKHIVGSGGKRIRPLLTLASHHLLYKKQHVLIESMAAALEFIHTATLLHDDVIDDTHERRHHPTARKLWGNKASILAGDFLFAHAFSIFVQSQYVSILDVISRTATSIAEGEMIQMAQGFSLDMSMDVYNRIIAMKTASLFEAATRIGGLLGDDHHIPESHHQAIGRFGYAFGMAFQMMDDICDYTEAFENNTIGNDFLEGKVTLPILIGLKHNPDLKEIFKSHLASPQEFRRIFSLLKDYDVFQEGKAMVERAKYEAIQALSVFSHPMVGMLEELTSKVINQ